MRLDLGTEELQISILAYLRRRKGFKNSVLSGALEFSIFALIRVLRL